MRWGYRMQRTVHQLPRPVAFSVNRPYATCAGRHGDGLVPSHCSASAPTRICTILSGSAGGSPWASPIDVFHAFDHLAPHRVLTVEVRRLGIVDEELAVGAVRVRGPGGAHGAAHERLVRELDRQVGLVGAAVSGAGRIPGLRHEPRNHPMEHIAPCHARAAKQRATRPSPQRCPPVGTRIQPNSHELESPVYPLADNSIMTTTPEIANVLANQGRNFPQDIALVFK